MGTVYRYTYSKKSREGRTMRHETQSYRLQKFMAYFLAVVAVGFTIGLIWLLALMVLSNMIVN